MSKKKAVARTTREEYRRKAATRAYAVELPLSLVARLNSFAARTNRVVRREVEVALETWLALSEQEQQTAREHVAKQHGNGAAD